MPLVKLKAISQDTWLRSGGGPSRDGVCYYMCNFIESDLGIWNKPMTFDKAIASAQSFADGSTMMSYAKAQNLRKAPQTGGYTDLGNAALEPNQIYRAWLQVVVDKNNPPADNSPNHEIIIVTGVNNSVAYFEPNFGFFQASNAGMNNTQALEFFINQQYGEFNSKMEVRGFGFLKVRSLTASSPKSFKDK